jgi:hypothetical protein
VLRPAITAGRQAIHSRFPKQLEAVKNPAQFVGKSGIMNRKHRCRISKRHVCVMLFHQTSGEGSSERRPILLAAVDAVKSEQPATRKKRNKIA